MQRLTSNFLENMQTHEAHPPLSTLTLLTKCSQTASQSTQPRMNANKRKRHKKVIFLDNLFKTPEISLISCCNKLPELAKRQLSSYMFSYIVHKASHKLDFQSAMKSTEFIIFFCLVVNLGKCNIYFSINACISVSQHKA